MEPKLNGVVPREVSRPQVGDVESFFMVSALC
jgi:hypothetical protein